jgi:Outer membrane protein beta-barrel domain
MSSRRLYNLKRNLSVMGAAILLAAGVARAQSTVSPATDPASGESSSQSYQFLSDDLNAAADPSPSGGSGQYDNRGGGGGSTHGRFHWAFEAGAGANGPIGNDKPFITWGGNFTVGAGLHLTHRLTVLGEYQFMDNKLPGALIAAGGADAGNAHINSITGAILFDLVPEKWATGVYAVGGGGYYHMSTNFTDFECCDFFGSEVPVTALSITSNQLGGNLGIGIYHKLGGVYGDGTMRLFAEARYTFINSPPLASQGISIGGGTTELIPITLGVRF